MKIAFNPSTVAALTTPPNNKDITFDLRGRNIFALGVKFYGTDTNTWRDIKINNVSIGSHTLDLRNGSNTTLTNTNGIVTINSTWRPVVDNLTSDSTTSSLSAKQGRVLKALIDGKSNSDHNHDGRYLRLTGGWMSGDINFGGDNKIYWGRNTDSASISFKNDGDKDADSYMSFVTSDNGNEYFRWSHNSDSTNTEWMALRSDGLRVRGTKVSLEGHTHDDRYYTKSESNARYITDITTSVNKLTFTKNGSNIIRDITVNVVHSQGELTNIPNKDATTKANPGLLIYNSYEQSIGTNSYSSVLSINTGGTIQIAGNWGDNQTRNLYWRSQSDRDVSSYPWKSWRTILDSENYPATLDSRYYTKSEVNSLLDAKLNKQNPTNYYWANVKISASSSTTTSPTVSNLTATSSIRMGNISLEHSAEINNITNGGIYLNYRNSGNVNLCYGGGNVGIGAITPSYKLDVNGQMRAGGFRHSSVNSDNYILLAGGGYKSFGGDDSTPIFLGCLDLYHGGDGTISSSFYCLGYSVPFTYTRGGNYCKIVIPDTTRLSFYIIAATASVNYSGGGMDTWTGSHRGTGAWWLHCYAFGWDEVRVKGFCQANGHNDSWWGGNPLWNNEDGANRITVCIFGHVRYI